jgi:hypothetical protein
LTYGLLISLLVVTAKDPRLRGLEGPNPLQQLAKDAKSRILGNWERTPSDTGTHNVQTYDSTEMESANEVDQDPSDRTWVIDRYR